MPLIESITVYDTVSIMTFFYVCFRIADFESEQQTNKRPTAVAADLMNPVVRSTMFEGPSSEEDNPLNWDPVVEACNKHVALSQVDSGRRIDFDISIILTRPMLMT